MLSELEIKNNRNKIISELQLTKREGIDNLIEHLDEIGFFVGPSSTKYHQAYVGGNAEHSIQVFNALDEMNYKLCLGISQDSIIITALLHDVCKADGYIQNKDATFRWNENAEVGHAKKSLRIISKFIKLSEEEENAILYHMGAYEKKEFDWNELGEAYRHDKLAYYIHVADMRSTYGF